jgi:hypothetical protein
MTVKDLQRYLHLLEKHMVAYEAKPGIPPHVRAEYLAELTVQRDKLRVELKGLQ